MSDSETKQLKTPKEKIEKSSARYYAKKECILRDNCIKNIQKNGRIPFLSSMEKHGISWEETARALEVYIRDHPAPGVEVPESEQLRKYKKCFPSKQCDNLTYLWTLYINTHKCYVCDEVFTKERKRTMNIDDHGFFTSVLCSVCAAPEKTQDEDPAQEKSQADTSA